MSGPMDDQPRSIEDAADDDDLQSELFPLGTLEGDGRTLANLVKGEGATNVELRAALSRAEVPLAGGLIDPNKGGRAIVHFEAAEYKQRPIREEQPDGNKKIVGWKFVCNLTSTYVQPLGDDEEAIMQMFERLMLADIQRASALADRLHVLSAGGDANGS